MSTTATSTRQRKTKARGLSPSAEAGAEDAEPAAATLEAPERGEKRREAETEGVGAGEHRGADADREHTRRPAGGLPPLRDRDRREQCCRGDDGKQDERHAAHERRRQRREHAVGSERIVTAVPEVVPDEGAVADQELSVEVSRSVAGRWAEHRQGQRDRAGDRGGAEHLAPGERGSARALGSSRRRSRLRYPRSRICEHASGPSHGCRARRDGLGGACRRNPARCRRFAWSSSRASSWPTWRRSRIAAAVGLLVPGAGPGSATRPPSRRWSGERSGTRSGAGCRKGRS